ncbi:MAG: hypothetical protein AAF829_11880 [Pseudomonadota bacterium]
MSRGKWTELFFLDEAVGLAAGHRPCYACRQFEAKAFCDAVGVDRVSKLNGLINTEMKRHLKVHGKSPRSPCRPEKLPNGAFYAIEDQAYLVWNGAARRFGWDGYGAPQPLHALGLRLTPKATCRALSNGYQPVMHPSL